MNVSMKIRFLLVVPIAAAALGLSGVASAGTQVGASVSFSGTRAAVVETREAHVCTYEQRPVTRRYTDASGGSYEHKTYETVRVCTHAPAYYPEVASTKVYVETRPKAHKERRNKRYTSYSVGVGYYGGSTSVHGSYGTSTYYGSHTSHHYGHSGHHGYRSYGHHYPRSSVRLSYGHGGSHHGYGHHGYGHYGHH